MRDRTEGVPLSDIHWPFLKRNMPPMLADEDDYTNAYGSPQWNDEGLVIRISQESYHILYDPGTSEWWVHNNTVRKRGLGAQEELHNERSQKYKDLFGGKGKLMAAREGDRLEKANEEFKHWVHDGPPAGTNTEIGKADDADETMGGT